MTIRVGKHVLWKKVKDEIVLVNPVRKQYSYLNATGATVWLMIRDKHSKAEIIDALCGRYNAPRSRIEKETGQLIAALARSKFIEMA